MFCLSLLVLYHKYFITVLPAFIKLVNRFLFASCLAYVVEIVYQFTQQKHNFPPFDINTVFSAWSNK